MSVSRDPKRKRTEWRTVGSCEGVRREARSARAVFTPTHPELSIKKASTSLAISGGWPPRRRRIGPLDPACAFSGLKTTGRFQRPARLGKTMACSRHE